MCVRTYVLTLQLVKEPSSQKHAFVCVVRLYTFGMARGKEGFAICKQHQKAFYQIPKDRYGSKLHTSFSIPA